MAYEKQQGECRLRRGQVQVPALLLSTHVTLGKTFIPLSYKIL